ncbi:hypothetical protein TRIP_B50449 [uncultured Desulfatiglans sp.]|uniref:Uncharacterized protein n=1 Tax=Uncultured Desulfatiglans sp. TaxID=1748965 RepID=A0A653AHT3_UNCDX|nr:hypothetical protein TRIP_B50449 [uncultured Desulfatiglans sp.]
MVLRRLSSGKDPYRLAGLLRIHRERLQSRDSRAGYQNFGGLDASAGPGAVETGERSRFAANRTAIPE